MPTTPDTAPTPPSLKARMSGMASRMTETLSASVPQHPALDSLSHSLRSLQQHHLPASLQSSNTSSSSTTAGTRELQWAITSQKGLALDHLAVSRDGTLASKEFYEWARVGLGEEDDLLDATDRLAFLSFTAAQLSTDLAKALDSARTPLKELRNLQNSIDSKNLALQKATHAKKPTPTESELRALQDELSSLQSSLPAKRRAAVLAQQQQSWAAYTEYSSKIYLLTHASSLLLAPLAAGEWDKDYAGHVRNSVVVALDRYEPGKFVEAVNWPDCTRIIDSVSNPFSDPASSNDSNATSHQRRPGSPSPSFASTHAVALASIQRDPATGIPSATGEPDTLPSDLNKPRRPSNASSASGRPSSTLPHHFSRSAQETAVFGTAPLGGRRSSGSDSAGAGGERPSVATAPAGGSSEGRSRASSGSLNLSPTKLPMSAGEVRSPPLPLASAPSGVIDQMTGEGSMPTVAETGVPVSTSSGPSSGQFVPRRPSATSSSSDGDYTLGRPSSFSTSPTASTTAAMPATPITASTASIEAQARERREMKRNSSEQQRRTSLDGRAGEGRWLAGEKDGAVGTPSSSSNVAVVGVTRTESTSSSSRGGGETLPGYETFEQTVESGPVPPGGWDRAADAGWERRLQ